MASCTSHSSSQRIENFSAIPACPHCSFLNDRPYFGTFIGATLCSMPKMRTLILVLGVGLGLLSCTKLEGNTSFDEAEKGFKKELTPDQRKAAIKQLQTETAAKP
jgi:hypothetical protein